MAGEILCRWLQVMQRGGNGPRWARTAVDPGLATSAQERANSKAKGTLRITKTKAWEQTGDSRLGAVGISDVPTSQTLTAVESSVPFISHVIAEVENRKIEVKGGEIWYKSLQRCLSTAQSELWKSLLRDIMGTASGSSFRKGLYILVEDSSIRNYETELSGFSLWLRKSINICLTDSARISNVYTPQSGPSIICLETSCWMTGTSDPDGPLIFKDLNVVVFFSFLNKL